MQSSWRVGSIFGIPFFIDPSWTLILAFMTLSNWASYAQTSWPTSLALVAGFTMAVLLFASVLLHELGHSLVARSQGIQVNSITLFLFGGIAAIEEESKTPGGAFQVAIAGPIVSLLLFGSLSWISQAIDGSPQLASMAMDLARINLVLAVFNLIPGLPLDGGQVLKAVVWQVTGDRLQGLQWAAIAGQGIGWLGITLGLFLFLFSGVSGLWLAVLGWFILRNAGNYRRTAGLQAALAKIKASEAMTREFRVIDANLTLRQFAEEYLLRASIDKEESAANHPYFASSDGRYRGLVKLEDLYEVERSRWEQLTLWDILRPLPDLVTVPENAELVSVINTMEIHHLPYITVLSPAGTVAGVIDRGDVVRAIAAALNSDVSESAIRQIKQQGRYPSDLPLVQIAQMVNKSRSQARSLEESGSTEPNPSGGTL